MNIYLAVLDNNENNGKTEYLPIEASDLDIAIGKARFYNSGSIENKILFLYKNPAYNKDCKINELGNLNFSFETVYI